jgi:uncharacterized protein
VRIVIDTNVMLSGLFWQGTPHALLSLARDGRVELITSPDLLNEFADVIQRPKFAGILQRTSRTPAKVIAELRQLSEIVITPPLPAPVCRDPDDDAVLACAIAAQVDAIVSGDDDLLTLKEFQGIPILSPAEALQRLTVGS